MANKLVTTAQYELHGSEDKPGTVLTIKKWSATLAFSMLGQLGNIAKESMSNLGDLNFGVLIGAILSSAEENQGRICMIVRRSIVDPPNITDEDILAWDPEDLSGVLVAILKLNLTDGLRKNFKALLEMLLPRREAGSGEAVVPQP